MDVTQKTQFEETPENLAAEEAAFEGAFNGADIEVPAAATSATEGARQEAEDPNGEQQAQQPQQTEQATEHPAGATEQPTKEPTMADLLAIVQKQEAIIEEQRSEQQKLRDQVFGRFGELKQKLDAVRSNPVAISPQARERLQEDFPELAAMLFDPVETSQEVEVPAAPAAPQAAATQEQPVETGTTFTEDQRVEMKLLGRMHSDWETVVASPEFLTWMKTLPAPEIQKLEDSWDAGFVSEKLTQFKGWREAEAKKAQQNQVRQERLDAALDPKGKPQRFTSSLGEDEEEAAMLAAYKAR